MPRTVRHAGVKTAGLLAAISVGTGLLTAAAVLPVAGIGAIASRDAAKTFNTLPVAGLGQLPARSELLDSRGNPIAYYYPRNIYRRPVTYNQIAPVMRNAIIAQEDSRFYQHGALDLRGTLRALITTASGSGTQGGSDLAQQYVKNACILTATTKAQAKACSAETVARKLRELRIAATVEHQMTRPQILAAYLNAAYFENQAYGIDVASEFYFSTSPSRLTLTEAAMLAGMVEDPALYDPLSNPGAALTQRNAVLVTMAQHGYITQAAAARASRLPLGLHVSSVPLQTGCYSAAARKAAFFCDYVLSVMKNDPAYAKAWSALNFTGGMKIYTTLNPTDQRAADQAVNFVLPPNNNVYNPNHDVDTEVLIQPGTGFVRAIAVNRQYGNNQALGQDSIDYAVNSTYNGGAGVQTGSSSKLFTLITALKQGIPFGFGLKVHDAMYVGGFTNCAGQFINPFQVHNADGREGGNIPLYFGTTASINAFYVSLESHVGLCNVVKTAVSLGVTRANGKSLLAGIGKPQSPNYQPPADDLASFTLGSVNVSPMSMAAAYATVAARGVYCHPIAIVKITDSAGRPLPVESAGCHRVLSQGVADAANWVLQGVLTSGTGAGRGIGRPAAAKTGTANGGYYAAFAGYTPTLAAYVSVFNPFNPTGAGAMLGCPQATYRDVGTTYPTCLGQMYGAMAPGATWNLTFLHAILGPPRPFANPPPSYFSMGGGTAPIGPPPKKHKPGNRGGGGNGH